MNNFDEIIEYVKSLSPKELDELLKEALKETGLHCSEIEGLSIDEFLSLFTSNE